MKPIEILADPNNLKCPCVDVECDWHGNCKDCVALHRYHATLPNCLEFVGNRKCERNGENER